MTTLYGIPNCDTIKKARKWLAEQHVDHEFHDYKKAGITAALLRKWATQVEWEVLLNKRGTTWRKLPDDIKSSVNKSQAIKLMVEQPSLIKRPVLVHQDQLLVGFDPASYAELLDIA